MSEPKEFTWLLVEKNHTGFYNFKLSVEDVESFWAWWNTRKEKKEK